MLFVFVACARASVCREHSYEDTSISVSCSTIIIIIRVYYSYNYIAINDASLSTESVVGNAYIAIRVLPFFVL